MARVLHNPLRLVWQILALVGAALMLAGLLVWLLPDQVPQEALFAPPPAAGDVPLKPTDRVLVLAPHPDDEVLGCGGVIQQALAMHVPVHVCFLTYGDSNEWSFIVYSHRPLVMGTRSVEHMGEVRHDEAERADAVLGLSPDDLTFLGYPDHGCLDIFTSHWGDRPPLSALLTRARAVPYANAFRPGAPYRGQDVLQDLEAVLRQVRPTVVFVSHPADQNVDHRALYLYTRVALWDLAHEMQPVVYPYLTHWPHWPMRHGYHPDLPLAPPPSLQQQLAWHVQPLSPAQVAVKHRALLEHKTQMAYSAGYLLAFVKQTELFGDLSRLDLTRCAVPSVTPQAGPEEPMPHAEPSSLVGNEWRFVRLDAQNRIELSIEEGRPLAPETTVSFYLFGYRPDRPFVSMPKLHIQVGGRAEVDDQGRRITPSGLETSRQGRRITVRVPLAALGDPDRVLVASRTWLGTMALDWNVWYELDLPGMPVATPSPSDQR